MRISSVGSAYPPYRYPQAVIAETLSKRWEGKLEEPRLLTRLHANCGVEFRNTVFPLEHYPTLVGFGANNDQWIKAAVELGETAINRALEAAGITAEDISAIFFASVTGIASPPSTPASSIACLFRSTSSAPPSSVSAASLEPPASLAPPTTSRPSLTQIALLLSVELCSLTWQDDDQSIANLISTGLFADGAAAVIVAGAESKLGKTTKPSPPHPRHPLHLLSPHRARHGLVHRRPRLQDRPLA